MQESIKHLIQELKKEYYEEQQYKKQQYLEFVNLIFEFDKMRPTPNEQPILSKEQKNLINEEFMKIINLVDNPSEKNAVTKRYNVDREFTNEKELLNFISEDYRHTGFANVSIEIECDIKQDEIIISGFFDSGKLLFGAICSDPKISYTAFYSHYFYQHYEQKKDLIEKYNEIEIKNEEIII